MCQNALQLSAEPRDRSRWRTESHRLREMEGILNAQPIWEERQSATQHARPGPMRSHHQPRGPIRIGHQRQQRRGNPYPPVIIIADDDAAGNMEAANRSSPSSITQTRVERMLVTHQRRHARGSRAEAHRFQGIHPPYERTLPMPLTQPSVSRIGTCAMSDQ